ncbi:hypothetical protein Ddc_04830 [Ditylenchus destructor]|nr:hypothetical protein Ddc_04830 [Ditylenchus destructor]
MSTRMGLVSSLHVLIVVLSVLVVIMFFATIVECIGAVIWIIQFCSARKKKVAIHNGKKAKKQAGHNKVKLNVQGKSSPKSNNSNLAKRSQSGSLQKRVEKSSNTSTSSMKAPFPYDSHSISLSRPDSVKQSVSGYGMNVSDSSCKESDTKGVPTLPSNLKANDIRINMPDMLEVKCAEWQKETHPNTLVMPKVKFDDGAVHLSNLKNETGSYSQLSLDDNAIYFENSNCSSASTELAYREILNKTNNEFGFNSEATLKQFEVDGQNIKKDVSHNRLQDRKMASLNNANNSVCGIENNGKPSNTIEVVQLDRNLDLISVAISKPSDNAQVDRNANAAVMNFPYGSPV